MKKLIEKFKDEPNEHNRNRLQLYIRKHPMAICMISIEDANFLTDNGLREFCEMRDIQAYNEYVKKCLSKWIKNATEARMNGNNERYWYCMRLVRYNRERFIHPR